MRWLPLLVLCASCAVRPRDNDNDGWFSHQDCDDRDPAVNPGAPEIPFDGKNNDCDLATLDDDGDQDGVPVHLDCNDYDPRVPGPEEIPYDSIDNDCDPSTPDNDLDGDGYPVEIDCDDTDPTLFPGSGGAPDGVDCDTGTLYEDLDGDGVPAIEDCDDSDPTQLAPRWWYADCDEDGFASPGADLAFGCQPTLAPVDYCIFGSDGWWTDIEPVHARHEAANTTTDCSDLDPDVFPGQTAFFTEPGYGLSGLYAFDYDCNSTTHRLYGLVQCYWTGTCTTPEGGFLEFTDCGVTGDFVESCEGFGTCVPSSVSEPLQQPCR